jgi:Methyltransferase domain
MMIDKLATQGVPDGRVETFDGSISDYSVADRKCDLMMIDGEHTNWACFRDFVHGRKLMAENAIIMFHDTSLVFNALKIIQEYLKATGT